MYFHHRSESRGWRSDHLDQRPSSSRPAPLQIPPYPRANLSYRYVVPTPKPGSAAKHHGKTEAFKQELINKHNREIRDRQVVAERTSTGKRVRFRLPASPPPVTSPKRRDVVDLRHPRRCKMCGHVLV